MFESCHVIFPLPLICRRVKSTSRVVMIALPNGNIVLFTRS